MEAGRGKTVGTAAVRAWVITQVETTAGTKRKAHLTVGREQDNNSYAAFFLKQEAHIQPPEISL